MLCESWSACHQLKYLSFLFAVVELFSDGVNVLLCRKAPLSAAADIYPNTVGVVGSSVHIQPQIGFQTANLVCLSFCFCQKDHKCVISIITEVRRKKIMIIIRCNDLPFVMEKSFSPTARQQSMEIAFCSPLSPKYHTSHLDLIL